jgi:hypothetical protein
MKRPAVISEEQWRYARVLNAGKRAGLACLMVTFIVYLAGWREPHVSPAELPKYWGLPVRDYLAATGAPAGWGWVTLAGRGDFLNFVGIAWLSAVTIVCHLAILPVLFRKKDIPYAVIAVLEVLVLVLAASGILRGGGH